MCLTRNQVYRQRYRGFESLPLRHFFIYSRWVFGPTKSNPTHMLGSVLVVRPLVQNVGAAGRVGGKISGVEVTVVHFFVDAL